jgi:hypothetical protein
MKPFAENRRDALCLIAPVGMGVETQVSFSGAVVLALALTAGCGPQNAAECIKQNSVPNMAPVAQAAVIHECTAQFPPKRGGSSPLPPNELQKVTGTLGPTYVGSSTLAGNLYNGTSVSLCVLRVSVETTRGGQSQRRSYDVDVKVQPMQASSFSFSYLPGDQYAGWYLESASSCAM